MDKFSYLSNAHSSYIEELYQKYKRDPRSVDSSWRHFFDGFEFSAYTPEKDGGVVAISDKEVAVMKLINAYRERGHLITKTNPIQERRRHQADLNLEYFGLSEDDLDTEFEVGNEVRIGRATLRDILEHLRKTYCSTIGVEYRHIPDTDLRQHIHEVLESTGSDPQFSKDFKLKILRKLAQSTVFEKFLHVKYGSQKRFSLEGGEAFIPALDAVFQEGARQGAKEFVLGMAHRGRLNVLVTLFGKSYESIFSEFDGHIIPESEGEGDVKYHQGHSADLKSEDGYPIHMSLVSNPSHLEAVNPVVHGSVRAKGEHLYQGDFRKIVPIIVHGDAAISGQGVNYEVANMARLNGYAAGGAIHIVINNQLGFTADFLETRSSLYCTDIAKINNAPVFHVNADDPEAVVYAAQIATRIRQQYETDVYIDMVGYRRYGHNEGDEPRFTQPVMYAKIDKHPPVIDIYTDKLKKQNVITEEDAQDLQEKYNEMLQEHFQKAKEQPEVSINFLGRQWKGLRSAKPEDFNQSPLSQVSEEILDQVLSQISSVPEGFENFSKLRRIFNKRKQLFEDGQVDWAMAELMAYGSLLVEKIPVRVSGQDSQRGTFGHRHAVFVDKKTEEEYIPLNNIAQDQARLRIYNSLLSEYGVLGFEYGYSLAMPNALVIWEAQFADFVNGAQIILDQFISSAETKWRRMSGLVLLLPHGYEGQGPEHSSANIYRFLGLAADNNMYVINPTTPANIFHALRRQVKAVFRKPLIVMSPKSLLRHPKVKSPISELKEGRFREILDDEQVQPKNARRVLLCSGKIYYELLKKREEKEIDDIAIVRMEQYYPIPKKQDEELYKKYKKVKEWFWVQEEPVNFGAWEFMRNRFKMVESLQLVSRRESASPATGSINRHQKEQKELLERALQ